MSNNEGLPAGDENRRNPAANLVPPPPPAAAVLAPIAMHSTFTIEPFDRHKMKWSRWVERLEGAFLLFNVPDHAKLPMLLHYMGGETYDTVSDRLAPEKPQTKSYDDIVQLLESHFNPRPLEILENFRFWCRRQGDERMDESIDDYLIALRKLAITCNFGNYLPTAIRNQFVFGLRDRVIQARLLEVHGLTLDRARELAVSMELSAKGGQEIQSRAKSEMNFVEHPATKSAKAKSAGKSSNSTIGDAKRSACYRCGSVGHFANKCVHIKTVCNYCRLVGHIQRVCQKKNRAPERSDTHQLESGESSEEDIDLLYTDEICGLYDNAVESCRVDKFWIELFVNQAAVNFEIDSGAPITVISVSDKEKLFPSVQLSPADLSLVSYSGNAIRLLGRCAVSVKYAENTYRLMLYVAETKKHPLLGRGWMKALHIDLRRFYEEVHTVSEISPVKNTSEAVKELISRYNSVCDGAMGKVKGLTAKLRLKPDAQPVYLKARPVPFSIKQAVEQEIEQMIRDGVLVKVNHSSWATPVVPVMKLNNKVRLCGDYKITVNPRLIVDEHPLPTVEELFANVAGGD
ncbi:uncharacterized protein LOC134289928 [Aedes albopictus]|uniref:CCHC-type domain-containing protein n=1 Tax=Aedes albopictus TaxID=7160 RepID=A0ABM1Y214_AEDAL